MNTPRPPRPVCRYFSNPGGCRAGSTCRYAHSVELGQSPQQSKQICRFYNNGHCRRGDQCWYRHVTPASTKATPSASASAKREEVEELVCSICFEEPKQFGLLTGCSHVFCLSCIKDWRNSKGKDVDVVLSNTNKTCPVCRAPSKFITPSSRFTPKDSPEREQCVKGYKATLGGIPCKYFIASPPEKRFCPYGKDCFYQHLNDDGTTHVFREGVEAMMERHKAKLLASRAISTATLMEAFMASTGFGRHWVPDYLDDIYDESDDGDSFAGSYSSGFDGMPPLIF
ncbi:hypothetical protein FRC08_018776 [Ceratobasidium sp. 394]|nr:hypothetical protein FRC08_018776 [Ceratobasidium sp. 394]KAG9092449.1 hypothetical protein FS749_015741 [Ceratobasidium sp. UAMH 11750]